MKEKSQSAKGPARLTLANSLRMRIGADGNLLASISKSSGEFYMAPEVLELVRLVAQGEGLKSLPKELKKLFTETLKNLPEQEEVEGIVNDLVEAGVLLREQGGKRRKLQRDGFGDPWVQWTMLADSKRTSTYIESLNAAVSEKTYVLDVGAGSGVLSAASLNAGAASVIAIEETDIASTIKETLKRLGLPLDRFKLFHGNSEDFQVADKRVDLVVSELFGNDPFCEGVVPTLRALAARLGLKKPSQFIPRGVTSFCEVVDLVDAPMRTRILTLQKLKSAGKENSIFMQKFLRAAEETFQIHQISFPFALRKSDFKRATESKSLGNVSLCPPQPRLEYYGKVEVHVPGSLSCPVALLWFRAQIDDKLTLSSHPLESDFAEHWSPVLIPFLKAPQGNAKVTISYRLNEEEDFLHIEIEQEGEKLASR